MTATTAQLGEKNIDCMQCTQLNSTQLNSTQHNATRRRKPLRPARRGRATDRPMEPRGHHRMRADAEATGHRRNRAQNRARRRSRTSRRDAKEHRATQWFQPARATLNRSAVATISPGERTAGARTPSPHGRCEQRRARGKDQQVPRGTPWQHPSKQQRRAPPDAGEVGSTSPVGRTARGTTRARASKPRERGRERGKDHQEARRHSWRSSLWSGRGRH